jgi:pyruvate dehydrogenase E1 component beta subunit
VTTPLSEGALVGVASGLALRGNRVIVEVMFCDFVALCFDQILNFATKSVSMYGRRVAVPVVVRCPVGGNRGYGATHSQSLQKHFIGIPHLALFELSPFHDNEAVLARMLDRGEPCMFFENKGLYPEHMVTGGAVDRVFRHTFVDDDPAGYAHVYLDAPDNPDCLVIAPGGLTSRVVPAMRSALLEREQVCHLIVPSQLYPLDIEPLVPLLRRAGRVCIVEDSVAGGTWGADVARMIYERLWGVLKEPILLVHPPCAVIPAAPQLERQVSVDTSVIHQALTGAARV